jgi:hypothetical protein
MRTVVVSSLLCLLVACYSESRGSQSPDLAFWFRCEERANPALENRIAGFLKAQGFRVLNLGKLQREHGVGIYDLSIDALDQQRRIIDIHAFRESPGSYSVGLYSPPPTKHDSALEEALLNFASKEIGCSTDQVTRNSNGSEAAEMHEWNVRRIEGLFNEAVQLNVSGAQQGVPPTGFPLRARPATEHRRRAPQSHV